MKTDQVYLTDTYKKTLETSVREVDASNSDYKVMLSATIFYPMGGGQPTDQGTITLPDSTILEVNKVMVEEGEIWHYIKGDGVSLKPGEEVVCDIKWDRRYKNMIAHTGGHILDFAMYKIGLTPDTLQPYKGDHGKKSYVVYKGEVDKDFRSELEDMISKLIESELTFTWDFVNFDELKNEVIYLQPGLPVNKPLRMLKLETVGAVADGGTICKNTSEIGRIDIKDISIDNNEVRIDYKAYPKEQKKDEAGSSKKKRKTLITELPKSMQVLIEGVKTRIQLTSSAEDLTNLWREYLGKTGRVKDLLKDIKNVDTTERKEYGQNVNLLRDELDQLINTAKAELSKGSSKEYLNTPQELLDNRKPKIGHLHPLTQTINEFNEIFRSLGYSIYDGPEIETDEYLFQRCNVPADHPARDLQDSIFVNEPNLLLRTQTSSIEAHILEELEPPYKIVIPGRVYRNEKVNKSNHFMFHQYQLITVQEEVSLAELIATMDHVFKRFLGDDIETRYRNKYYPEVEPGIGPDMKCFNCNGDGCGICKHRGWMEMAGAGIVHPNMMRMAGLDTDKWQGMAFGLGLDRWAMAKHKITDIRTLLGGNLAYKPNIA